MIRKEHIFLIINILSYNIRLIILIYNTNNDDHKIKMNCSKTISVLLYNLHYYLIVTIQISTNAGKGEYESNVEFKSQPVYRT